jgi:hypothetical protein
VLLAALFLAGLAVPDSTRFVVEPMETLVAATSRPVEI